MKEEIPLNIIDSHAHIYPDAIAARASEGIADFYHMPTAYDGSLASLFASGDKAGIDHFVVCSVATLPAQVRSINAFIAKTAAENPGRITGLGALHPDSEDVRGDIDDIIGKGLNGAKLHPDFQRFYLDEPKAMRVFQAFDGRLPVLVHTGDSRYDYSRADRLLKVLKAFPKLTVVAAHFGGWSVWRESAEVLYQSGVYVDTCSSLYALSPEEAKDLIGMYGDDRVLFGVDFPMWDHAEELARFNRLDLDEARRERILSANSARVYNIDRC